MKQQSRTELYVCVYIDNRYRYYSTIRNKNENIKYDQRDAFVYCDYDIKLKIMTYHHTIVLIIIINNSADSSAQT